MGVLRTAHGAWLALEGTSSSREQQLTCGDSYAKVILMASQTAKQSKDDSYPKPKLSTVFGLGFLFALPFIMGSFLFNAYQKLDYGTLADVQGMSMIFIGLFMAFVVLSVVALKMYHTRLYMTYSTSRGIFWLSLFLLVPLLWMVRELTSGGQAQQFNEIIVRASIASVLFLIVSTLGIAVLSYVLARLTKKTQ